MNDDVPWPCVSEIWTRLSWLILGSSQLEIKVPQKIVDHVKSGQNLCRNNQLATFSKVQPKSLICSVESQKTTTVCIRYLDKLNVAMVVRFLSQFVNNDRAASKMAKSNTKNNNLATFNQFTSESLIHFVAFYYIPL